jgi:hypothetical protein
MKGARRERASRPLPVTGGGVITCRAVGTENRSGDDLRASGICGIRRKVLIFKHLR